MHLWQVFFAQAPGITLSPGTVLIFIKARKAERACSRQPLSQWLLLRHELPPADSLPFLLKVVPKLHRRAPYPDTGQAHRQGDA